MTFCVFEGAIAHRSSHRPPTHKRFAEDRDHRDGTDRETQSGPAARWRDADSAKADFERRGASRVSPTDHILDRLKKCSGVNAGTAGESAENELQHMKCSRQFPFLVLLFAGFLVSACSEPDPQMAELQRIYAEKGEGTPPAVKKVAKRNTQQGTTPYLSTTNSPLSTTNSPAKK